MKYFFLFESYSNAAYEGADANLLKYLLSGQKRWMRGQTALTNRVSHFGIHRQKLVA